MGEWLALAGIGLLLAGLYGFGYTLHLGNSISEDAGILRVVACVIAMLAGTYLITSAAYP
jgi:hypothetical protein